MTIESLLNSCLIQGYSYLCPLLEMIMIRFEDALEIVGNAAKSLAVERVGLRECLGRILAGDVFSDMDMPPFDKSAVDGYACRREDLGKELNVLEVIPAGFDEQPFKAQVKNDTSK